MFKYVSTKIEIKILLLLVAVLILGFGSYVIVSIQKESSAMLKEHDEKLQLFSETIMAGIRNVMLTGKAPIAAAFVNDARENLNFGSMTIYDRFGKEVFLREGEGVAYHVNEPNVQKVISTSRPLVTITKERMGDVWAGYQPIMNGPQCWRCHGQAYPLRGVISLTLHPEQVCSDATQDSVNQVAGIIGDYVAGAFRAIMLGGKGADMDTLMFSSRKEIPVIKNVRVYTRNGDLAFGEAAREDVIPDTIKRILVEHNEVHVYEKTSSGLRLYLPLVNQDRCQVCHGSVFPMRGVMVFDFDSGNLQNISNELQTRIPPVLQTA